MAMKQALVEIKKPCTVNLDSMESNGNGKFCSVCQTSIIDFTNKSVEEISTYFQTYKTEKTCGIFRSELVRTDNRTDNFISYLYRKKLKFAAVFITGLLVLTGCKTKKHTGTTYGGPRFLDEKINPIENVK